MTTKEELERRLNLKEETVMLIMQEIVEIKYLLQQIKDGKRENKKVKLGG